MRYPLAMTEIETNILNTLLELERTVAALPGATPKPNLLPLFIRLDELSSQLPRETTHRCAIISRRKATKRRGCSFRGRTRRTRREAASVKNKT
jgi:hypothetical protein